MTAITVVIATARAQLSSSVTQRRLRALVSWGCRQERARRAARLADLLQIAGSASAGSLLRCHLALAAELEASAHELPAGDETADAWRPVIFDNTDTALAALEPTQEPPPAYELAQDATIWIARAIDLIDQHHPDRIAALTQAIARLLAITAFTQLASAHTFS